MIANYDASVIRDGSATKTGNYLPSLNLNLLDHVPIIVDFS
jgi:hypothetical protein